MNSIVSFMTPSTSHVDISANDQNIMMHLIWIVLTSNICSGTTDITPVWVTMVSNDQKSHVALCFDHIDLINAMVLFTVPLAPYFNHLDLTNALVPFTMQHMIPVVSHYQESHIAPILIILKCNDATDASASCDADASANGITNQKVMLQHIWIVLNSKKGSGMLIMSLAWHDSNVGANVVTWPNKSCCTLFQSSWPN